MEEVDVVVFLNGIRYDVRMPAYQYAALGPRDYIHGVNESPYACVVMYKTVHVGSNSKGTAVLFIAENTVSTSLDV